MLNRVDAMMPLRRESRILNGSLSELIEELPFLLRFKLEMAVSWLLIFFQSGLGFFVSLLESSIWLLRGSKSADIIRFSFLSNSCFELWLAVSWSW